MPGQEIFDGFVELRNGMNGARNPALLAETQVAKAVNATVRGGLVRTRPAFVQESVTGMPTGLFQGAGVWSLESGDRIVFVVAGKVYSLIVNTNALTDHGLQLSTTAQCFFTQVDRYFVCQDGSSTPFILEETAGVAAEYAGAPSIPSGYMGVYAHGRYHMVPTLVPSTAVDGRPYLVSGDILDTLDPTTVLEFTETEYLAAGGAHGLPVEMGHIGGLGVFRNAQTGTGVGQVIVLGRNGVCAFDFSVSRTLWQSQALSQVLFFGAGTKSPWAVVNVNDDLVYRADDGLRVLRYTVSQTAGASGSLSNTPMSIEVDQFLSDDAAYLPYASATLIDNRMLATASGTGTYYFQGLISWDLAAAYYSGVQGTGVYDGIWTGDDFAQVLTALRSGKRTGFVFASGPILYRIDSSVHQDNGDTSIESRIETKSFLFGDAVTRKKLNYVEMWVSDLRHDVDLEVWFRPHGYPLWASLGTRSIEVPTGSLPQARRRVRFAVDFPNDFCDSVSGEPLYTATDFQFAIQWTGNMTIERFRASVEPLLEAPPDPCDSDGVTLSASATSGETLDDFSYSIRGS